eukprot:642860-Alexandrium_andersonii.AAC.1
MDQDEHQVLRQALLGPAAEAWPRDGPGPQPTGRAVILIDQSKAFERLAPASRGADGPSTGDGKCAPSSRRVGPS